MAENKQSTEKEKGVSIFLDVFRRADKNDDGALSWEEFKTFFSDGILSSDDLLKLFNEIDTHNTNNLDTSEICEYFTKHLGPFAQVYGCLEEMNVAIINALMTTAKNYPESSFLEKFTTRFLLKEVVSQLSCLESHLDTAVEKINEQEMQNRSAAVPNEAEDSPAPVSRKMKRMQRSYAQQTSVVEGSVQNALSSEIDRLADLVTKMEGKIKFDVVEEEEVDPETAKQILLICRKFNVIPKRDENFRESLKTYIGSTSLAEGCLHLCLRSFRGRNQFVLYEIWESTEDHQKHFAGETSKMLMHGNIDNLYSPEDYSKMTIPASWWSKDN